MSMSLLYYMCHDQAIVPDWYLVFRGICGAVRKHTEGHIGFGGLITILAQHLGY